MTELDTGRLSRAEAASAGGSGDWRPADTFADRLSRVRRHMGWNATEASIECGFSRQNWRKWEVEGTRPSDMASVVEKIHVRTGVDRMWLMWGDLAGTKATLAYLDTYLFGTQPDVTRPSLDVPSLVPAA